MKLSKAWQTCCFLHKLLHYQQQKICPDIIPINNSINRKRLNNKYLFSKIPLKTSTEIMHSVFNIVILLELANVDILLNISDPKISAHINKVQTSDKLKPNFSTQIIDQYIKINCVPQSYPTFSNNNIQKFLFLKKLAIFLILLFFRLYAALLSEKDKNCIMKKINAGYNPKPINANQTGAVSAIAKSPVPIFPPIKVVKFRMITCIPINLLFGER